MRTNIVYVGIFIAGIGFLMLIAMAPTDLYPLIAFISYFILIPIGIIIAIIGTILKKKKVF